MTLGIIQSILLEADQVDASGVDVRIRGQHKQVRLTHGPATALQHTGKLREFRRGDIRARDIAIYRRHQSCVAFLTYVWIVRNCLIPKGLVESSLKLAKAVNPIRGESFDRCNAISRKLRPHTRFSVYSRLYGP